MPKTVTLTLDERLASAGRRAKRLQKVVNDYNETRRPKPKAMKPRPSAAAAAKAALKDLLPAIENALAEKNFKAGSWSYPFDIDQNEFRAELSKLLPTPMQAVDDSTVGYDATSFYTVSWQPANASGNDCLLAVGKKIP